jgi:cellulose synthase/poly-beta-1,6-N-acetylglucosamine synthase-like glycosyltransferase
MRFRRFTHEPPSRLFFKTLFGVLPVSLEMRALWDVSPRQITSTAFYWPQSRLPVASLELVARTEKAAAVRPAPEFCLVVLTFNEVANVRILVERLGRALAFCEWEVVFVDDNSPDGTAALACAIGEADSRVRCIRRIGRRGLAGACLEGMLASQARYLGVMDADLQHDEGLLLPMLDCLRAGRVDLVVVSRYLCDGSAPGLLVCSARFLMSVSPPGCTITTPGGGSPVSAGR